MNFAYKLRTLIKQDIFNQSELKALLYPMSDAAIHNGISRALKSKDILRLKRGLYVFSKKLRTAPVSTFLIANKLYGPSYVSFESSLSHYGLIPESVYTTTSACHQRKAKHFNNDLGDFSFDYIPCQDFFLGVTHNKTKGGVLIASPLRALFDLIYLRKKRYQSINQLEQDLRIEVATLKNEVCKYSVAELEELARQYHKKNTVEVYRILIKEFK